MTTRVISYIRFSSVEQALGDSERRQIEKAQEYCAKHGLKLADSDVLRDLGLSAYRGAHAKEGEFAGFLEAVNTGAILRGTILIVEARDRLSREPVMRAFHQMTGIILAGIKVVTLRDGLEHDEETIEREPYRLFHSLSLLIAAHAESLLKAQRVAEAWADKRLRAAEGAHVLTPIRPAWVDLKDGKLVLNAERAEVVRRILRMVADGLGCYTVAKRLQAERVPPLSGDKKSNGWNKSRILAIVMSDVPLGVLHTYRRGPDGKTRIPDRIIENYYPKFVDQTLVDCARAMVRSRSRKFGGEGAGRKGTVVSNLFTRIAKCHCGASMFLSNRLASRSRSGWLRCSNAARGKDCTNNAGISYQPLEESVLRDVGWFETMRKHLPSHDPSREITERIAEKEAEAKRIDITLSALTDEFGKTPLFGIAKQMRERAERQEAIYAEIVELRKQFETAFRKAEHLDVPAERDRILVQSKSIDPNPRFEARSRIATALRQTIDSIICYPDRAVHVTFSSVTVEGAERVVQLFTFRIIYDPQFDYQMLMEEADVPDDERQIVDITGVPPSMVLSSMQMHLGDGRIGYREHVPS